MKKTLVVYYSRSGRTEAVARELAALCDADLECIEDAVERRGFVGLLRCALEALLGGEPAIQRSRLRPQDYRLVIVGTPVWLWSMAGPVRTYLDTHRGNIGRLATFCTMGRTGQEKVLTDMTYLAGRQSVARLALSAGQIRNGEVTPALTAYLARMQQPLYEVNATKSRATVA